MNSILVVEDSSDLRAIMRIALEGEGYSVAVATNGKEALEYLKSSAAPDLILLDLMMPVMNGWEFLEAKKSDTTLANIPIVVCSAIKPDNLGDVGFLKKPVDFDDLINAVQKYIEA